VAGWRAKVFAFDHRNLREHDLRQTNRNGGTRLWPHQ
jgi:hypothetical protein